MKKSQDPEVNLFAPHGALERALPLVAVLAVHEPSPHT